MSVSFTYFIVGKVGEMLGAWSFGSEDPWLLLLDGFTAAIKGGLAFRQSGGESTPRYNADNLHFIVH